MYDKKILLQNGSILLMNNSVMLYSSQIKQFAVVSDLHLDSTTQGSVDDFDRALTMFENRGITDVFCCGDIVSNAQSSSYANFTTVKNRHPSINFYSCKGNHDYAYSAANWQSTIGTNPNYALTIDGCRFILMSIDTSSNPSSTPYSSSTLSWLQTELTNAAGIPVFLFMHYPLNSFSSSFQYAGLNKEQIYGYASGSAQCTQILDMLKTHGDVVAFSGHSHYAFSVESDYPWAMHYSWLESGKHVDLLHVPSLAIPRDKDMNTIDSGSPSTQPAQGYIMEYPQNGIVEARGIETGQTASDRSRGDLLPDHDYICPTAVPTAKDYIKSSLLALWDGAENAGYDTHNSTASTWKNLASSTGMFDMSRTYVSWDSNAANFTRSQSQTASTFKTSESTFIPALSGEWTIECAFCPDAGYFQNYAGLIGDHYSTGSNVNNPGIVGLQYESGNINLKVYCSRFSTTLADGSSGKSINSYVQAGVPVSISFQGSESIHTAKVYVNGQLVITVPNVTANYLILKLPLPFLVGSSWSGGTDRGFSGKVYNVRAYTRALSSSEVADNFAVDKARFSIA